MSKSLILFSVCDVQNTYDFFIRDRLVCIQGYKLEPEYETNFSIFNEPSVENVFTIPMNKTLYTNQMQYLFRSRHYNHAKAYGLSGENGPSATIEALETFGYETAEQDLYLNFHL